MLPKVGVADVRDNQADGIRITRSKGLGAGISLNEFGAGYSSLAYLHRLAVDAIKIDRSLISHGSDNKSGAVVLRAAMAMSRELGKDVIAVGMEREEDVAYVRALGCDYAQGLYFGEAMTEREVMSVLNTLSKSSRRDEKRARKRKGADELPTIELMGEESEDEDLIMLPTQSPSGAKERSDDAPISGLPVPRNMAAKAKRRGFGAGLFSALMRPFISDPAKPSLGTRLLGLFTSSKKSASKAKAKAKTRRRPPPPKRAVGLWGGRLHQDVRDRIGGLRPCPGERCQRSGLLRRQRPRDSRP